MTIVEFLEARFAEDEAVAVAATKANWYASSGGDFQDVNVSGVDMWGGSEQFEPLGDWRDNQGIAHIQRHDPARVLREVAAKRATIDEEIRNLEAIDNEWGCSHKESEIRDGHCDEDGSISASGVLRALASVYVEHLDFNPDWTT